MNFESIFDIKLPIIQAPMAGVQDSSLAIAVARAGGLGSLPCASLSIQEIETQLQAIQNATDSPINLNFFCHQLPEVDVAVDAQWMMLLKPYFEELNIDPETITQKQDRASFSHEVIDAIEPYAPQIVSFHFGLPANEHLTRVKNWGAKILSTATTIEEANWLSENGADIIIAQGVEAGGHRGMFLTRDLKTQLGTDNLLKQILANVSLPVIAAGGISSATDVSKQLNNGAIAAQIGSAYLLCEETKSSDLHRQAILQDKAPKTALTNLFTGRPARAIINRVINDIGPINHRTPEYPLAIKAMSALRNMAEQNQSSDFSPLWCGQNTQGCSEISAYDLTINLATLIS